MNLILSDDVISYSVINLWKCGSKKLNYTLSHGGCTTVDLEDWKINSTSRFPKMLCSLHRLRTLRIRRGKEILAGAYELRELLWRLPGSIESLNLTCKEAESCFFRNPEPDHHHAIFTASINDKSSCSSSPFLDHATGSPLWDIGSKFPNLTNLSLRAWHSSMIAPYCNFLPSTVTELAILAPYHDTTPPKMSSQLVSLKLNLQKVPTDLSFLPLTLERLENQMILSVGEKHLKGIPKNLKETNLEFEWSPMTADQIPKGLRSLRINCIDQYEFDELNFDWETHIPSSLTSLTVMNETVLTGSILLHLPSTITYISVRDVDWSSIERETDYPSSLKHFKSICKDVSSDDIKQLPRGLISLAVFFSGDRMRNCFEMLPPKLENLHFLTRAFHEKMLLNNEFPPLPKTLISLKLVPELTISGPFIKNEQNAEKKIPCSVIDRIPPNLRLIDINWASALWNELPDTLETVHSQNGSEPISSFTAQCDFSRRKTGLACLKKVFD